MPGGKSPEQIDRFLQTQRANVTPGVLGQRSSSDSELWEKRASNEVTSPMTSSDDNPQLLAGTGDPPRLNETNRGEEDRLGNIMSQADWAEKIEAAKRKADQMVRNAEVNKAEVIKPPGTLKTLNVIDQIERHKDTD